MWGIEFKKKKNSTKIPTTPGVQKEVVIKGNFGFENQFQSTKCSTIAPSFFVTGAAGFGYLKAWNNYYWITNIAFDINGAEYIDCRIDVLASWRSFIQESYFFVDRCADPTYYNTDIFDDALSIEDGAEVSSSARTEIFSSTAGSYLITILGKSSSSGMNTYLFSNPPPADIFSPLFEMNTDGTGDIDSITDITDGIKALIKNFAMKPSDFIVSCKRSPLGSAFYNGTSDDIYIGWWKTGRSATKVPDLITTPRTVSVSKPSSIYSDFRRTDARCSKYQIYFPGVGTVDLSSDLIELALTAKWSLDVISGSIHYDLHAGGALVGSYDGCIYSDTGYGGSSVASGAIAQTAGGLISTASAKASKEIMEAKIEAGKALAGAEAIPELAAVAGIVSAIHGVGEAISGQPSLASPNGGCAGAYCHPYIEVSAVQKHTAEFPVVDYGRPCCRYLKLGDLTGFVRCANASIDIAAVLGVREEINTYLNTGFFME